MRNIIKLLIAIAFVVGAYLVGFNFGRDKITKELKLYKQNVYTLKNSNKLIRDSILRVTYKLDSTIKFHSEKIDSLSVNDKKEPLIMKDSDK